MNQKGGSYEIVSGKKKPISVERREELQALGRKPEASISDSEVSTEKSSTGTNSNNSKKSGK